MAVDKNDYALYFISFLRKGTDAHNCLSVHKNQTPDKWHIELLKDYIAAHENDDMC